ncbi:permease-like cell division protein FtsX [Nonomuraea sp. NPDC049152]|uniref:permease-like cell division protein FtsX n=1 Tax=Nonomuraea sp. NPDC049152 TaxID=3154350 RepID=UPI0033D3689F
MNSPMEDRLHDALSAAAATVAPETIRPLHAPARRRRWRVDVRFMAIAVTLAGVVAAVALWPAERQEQRLVLAAGVSLTALDDGVSDVSVYLCKPESPFPACKGAAPVDRNAVQRTLQAMPQVEEIRFESQEEAFAEFRRSRRDLAQVVVVDDMPESFRLRLRPGTDWDALVEAATEIEGVSMVIKQGCYALQSSSWFRRAVSFLSGADKELCRAP